MNTIETWDSIIDKINDTRKPYTEFKLNQDSVLRLFKVDAPDHLYKWHFDEEDRIIEPFIKNDWKFQYDNEIPIHLSRKIKIKKNEYHRVIKGTHNLPILIKFK